MERGYRQNLELREDTTHQSRYTPKRDNFLSEEDRLTEELYEPLIRPVPLSASWNY